MLRCGGRRPDDPALGDGYYYRPTVLDECRAGMSVVRDESFGPVLTVERFSDEDDAVRLANDTDYGLAGAVWTHGRRTRAAGRAAAAARHRSGSTTTTPTCRRPSGAATSSRATVANSARPAWPNTARSSTSGTTSIRGRSAGSAVSVPARRRHRRRRRRRRAGRRTDRARLDRRHAGRPGRPAGAGRFDVARARAGVSGQLVEDDDRVRPLHGREALRARGRRRALLPAGRRPRSRDDTRAGWPNCTAATAGSPPGGSRPSCSTPPRRCARYPLLDRRRRPRRAVHADGRAGQGGARGRCAGAPGGARGARRSWPGTRCSTSWSRTARCARVVTDQGEIAADIVVCCAGIWGPTVAAMVGMTLPLTPLEHQLAWTTPLPALAGASREATLPILRHQDQDLYYRERFDTLGVGYYGHRPMPVDAAEIVPLGRRRGHAVGAAFTPDDFAEAWKQTQVLLPATRERRVADGHQRHILVHHRQHAADRRIARRRRLLGRRSGLGDAFGRRRAGDGRAARRRVLLHLRPARMRREPVRAAPARAGVRAHPRLPELRRGLRHHPSAAAGREPAPDPRPARSMRARPSSARCSSRRTAGSVRSGTRRTPAWSPVARCPQPNDWAARYWSPIVAAEAKVTREAVAIYDMTALKRLQVTGPGAAAFLQRLVTGDVDKSVGSVTYCLLLDVDGGIRSDITIARLGARPVPGRRERQPRPRLAAPPAAGRRQRAGRATSRPAPAASGCGGRAPAT